MKKRICIGALCLLLCSSLAACGDSESKSDSSSAVSQSSSAAENSSSAADSSANSGEKENKGIDYMALVNKLNPLPENWESSLETVHFTNTVGDDVEVEKKAYDAYLKLKAELEKEGVHVDLDSARRSVADQQRIMDDFTKEYGADYAAKTVAKPGYSEHHTGLALDLYLIIDGKDVVLNEEMVKYPEIWAKIHAKIADYGFILRYLEDKEYITGYGYEPWHLRYIDDVQKAKEITSKGLTFEEYLGAVKSSEVKVDYGSSKLFTQDEIKEASVQLKCKFASFESCTLKSLVYAGDENSTEENLRRMNETDKDAGYTKVIEFTTDFSTGDKAPDGLDTNSDIKEYKWWLALDKDGSWQIVKTEK